MPLCICLFPHPLSLSLSHSFCFFPSTPTVKAAHLEPGSPQGFCIYETKFFLATAALCLFMWEYLVCHQLRTKVINYKSLALTGSMCYRSWDDFRWWHINKTGLNWIKNELHWNECGIGFHEEDRKRYWNTSWFGFFLPYQSKQVLKNKLTK